MTILDVNIFGVNVMSSLFSFTCSFHYVTWKFLACSYFFLLLLGLLLDAIVFLPYFLIFMISPQFVDAINYKACFFAIGLIGLVCTCFFDIVVSIIGTIFL